MDGNDSNPNEDDDSVSTLLRLKGNDSDVTELDVDGDDHYIQNMYMSDDEWEELSSLARYIQQHQLDKSMPLQ